MCLHQWGVVTGVEREEEETLSLLRQKFLGERGKEGECLSLCGVFVGDKMAIDFKKKFPVIGFLRKEFTRSISKGVWSQFDFKTIFTFFEARPS